MTPRRCCEHDAHERIQPPTALVAAVGGGRVTATGLASSAPVSDWALLWRELVTRAADSDPGRFAGDYWAGRAESFDDRLRRARSHPDRLLEFVLARIAPDHTVLDIGAGTGGWTLPMARRAALVTALDSSAAMREVLWRKIEAEAAGNIEVRAGTWPDTQAELHDHVLAAHSVYGTADLPRFVNAMTATARRNCYLVVTCPLQDSVTTRAARELWGSPRGRPDFVVAYNVMLDMGLTPNVLMDRAGSGATRPVSLAEALGKLKRLLGIGAMEDHDARLLELLGEQLEPDGDGYLWPPQARSALVYWSSAG